MKKYIIISLITSLMFSGCWFLRVGMKNIGDAIFNEPQRVKNKIKDPIKDNVSLSALWIGHSSVLLQIDDKVVLIDPVFEDVIAGVVLRKVEAGLDIEAIPKLDLILISHAHMDHLSFETLDKLDNRFPSAKIVVPRGAEKYLPAYDMEIIRMKTGNSKKRNYTGSARVINGIKITTVYALHQGGRFGLDSYSWNVPGCTGYIIEYNGKTIFYAGDTTFDDTAYKDIGQKYNIDLALIPIGPCRECDIDGSYYHLGTLGALKVLDDLRAEHMIPVHYGIIEYFNDPDTPMWTLRDLISQYGSTTVRGTATSKPYSERIKILEIGGQYILKYK